ncbi:unnamed protein product [Mytilus coruscus]|uniref:B box-type domain-containing protein n=1 Tax=Mytilus coruscus TaxID=42192 RepID=A0A6J8B0L5_MYTCO|nr:unnamed protein product [Mytilus coruscus]
MAQCPIRSCEICENSPANRFCKICEQFFCHPCEISHLKIRPCRNHVFQDADKVNVEVKTPVCEQHEEFFTHYCKTCTALICYICLPTTHKTHDFCIIDDEAKEKKYSLEKQADKSKKDIEEKVAVIVGTLNDMKNDFLKSIDEQKLEESQKIEPEILKRINATNKCQKVLNKIKRSFDGNNNINLLDSFSDMTKTLESISGMSNWKTLPIRVRFDPVSMRPEPETLIGKISFLNSTRIELQKYQRPLLLDYVKCENSPGSRYCTDCEQCFCKLCETSHLKTKSCRNHVFQDADITNPEVKTPSCKQHDKKFTYYCNTCTLLTCNICLPTSHNKHDFCLIDDAASKARSLLNKDVFAAEDAISSAKQTICTSRLTLKTIEDDANKAKGDIDETVTDIVNAIHNPKDEYFKSIEEHKIKESHKLKEDIMKIEKVTENSQEVLKKMKSSIAEENNVMLLDSFSDMTKTLKSIRLVSMETTIPSRIQFHPVLTTFEAEKLIGDINFVKPNTISTKADTVNFVKSNTAITVGDRVRLKSNFDRSSLRVGVRHGSVGEEVSLNNIMAQCPVRFCEICEKRPGSRYCTECEQFFCTICEISHLKSKSCRNHFFEDAEIAYPEVKNAHLKFEDETDKVKKDIVERVDVIVNALNDTKDSYFKSFDEHRMKETRKLKQDILDIEKATEKDQKVLNKM